MSNKCTSEQIAKIKKAGNQAQNLVKSVTKLSHKLNAMNKKRLEEEKERDMGKHTVWYSNIAESQATKQAKNTVEKIVKNYEVDVSILRRNINYLQTLLNFNNQSNDLLHFYISQTNAAEEKSQQLRKKAGVDHRLATFYNNKDTDTSPWNHYLFIIYWIVFSIVVILFIKDLYRSYKQGQVIKGVREDVIIMTLLIFLPLFIIPLLKLIKKIFLPYSRP